MTTAANANQTEFGRRRAPAAACGFSLIEVMISVVVLSVGALGLAGLQIVGLKEGQASYQRTQAVLLAYEMADRMRANRIGAAAGGYVLAPSLSPSPATGVSCVAPAVSCTPAQIAAYDLQDWDRRVRTGLSSGRARIACAGPCGSGRRQTVTVMWDEDRSGVVGTGCAAADDLACFTVNVTP